METCFPGSKKKKLGCPVHLYISGSSHQGGDTKLLTTKNKPKQVNRTAKRISLTQEKQAFAFVRAHHDATTTSGSYILHVSEKYFRSKCKNMTC